MSDERNEELDDDPTTPQEWQEAVDLACFYLAVHAAVLYGLVTCGAEINVMRCEEILARGRERGVVPAPRVAAGPPALRRRVSHRERRAGQRIGPKPNVSGPAKGGAE